MLSLVVTLVLLLFALPNLYPEGEVDPPPAPVAEAEVVVEAAEAVPVGDVVEEPVSCYWTSILPDRDFEPEAGDVYLIAVDGSDRQNLSFSYRRLRPFENEARIAVHTQKTPDNRILVDQDHPGLFTAETGEFTLTLFVPEGWPLYLVEESDNPYGNPTVLSNIVELP